MPDNSTFAADMWPGCPESYWFLIFETLGVGTLLGTLLGQCHSRGTFLSGLKIVGPVLYALCLLTASIGVQSWINVRSASDSVPLYLWTQFFGHSSRLALIFAEFHLAHVCISSFPTILGSPAFTPQGLLAIYAMFQVQTAYIIYYAPEYEERQLIGMLAGKLGLETGAALLAVGQVFVLHYHARKKAELLPKTKVLGGPLEVPAINYAIIGLYVSSILVSISSMGRMFSVVSSGGRASFLSWPQGFQGIYEGFILIYAFLALVIAHPIESLEPETDEPASDSVERKKS